MVLLSIMPWDVNHGLVSDSDSDSKPEGYIVLYRNCSTDWDCDPNLESILLFWTCSDIIPCLRAWQLKPFQATVGLERWLIDNLTDWTFGARNNPILEKLHVQKRMHPIQNGLILCVRIRVSKLYSMHAIRNLDTTDTKILSTKLLFRKV